MTGKLTRYNRRALYTCPLYASSTVQMKIGLFDSVLVHWCRLYSLASCRHDGPRRPGSDRIFERSTSEFCLYAVSPSCYESAAVGRRVSLWKHKSWNHDGISPLYHESAVSTLYEQAEKYFEISTSKWQWGWPIHSIKPIQWWLYEFWRIFTGIHIKCGKCKQSYYHFFWIIIIS